MLLRVLVAVVSALLASASVGSAVPNGYAWGCLNISSSLPFCDHTLPLETRLDDLLSRLTLEEQVGLLGPDKRTGVDQCNMMDAGVVRLGIPPYMHLVETNTAVASACLAVGVCATEFPGPTGLGASFNRTLWRTKGEVISTEMRAFNNINWHRGTGDAPLSLIGLTGFGPNINIVRDPRFGRNSELPSEDPLVSGKYAANYVRGCQEGDDPRYLKMVSGLKHFDAYSVEDNRGARSFNISLFDMWDTYLAQYRIGFIEGNAQATMCSYASINGVPSCANNYILNDVVRNIWNRSDVVVGTDCGAVNNMISLNHYAKDAVDAVTKTINGGADLELGDNYFSPVSSGGPGTLQTAVARGLVSAQRIAESVRRVISKRFRLGQFDPLAGQPYAQIGADVVNSTAHQAINLDAALQSMVLLKNSGVLPLRTGIKVAVVGPHSVSQRDLLEDYAGDQRCYGATDSCIPTIGGMVTAFNVGGQTLVSKGVDMNSADQSQIPAALSAVRSSDFVILCLGIGHNEEQEGMDRSVITLPGQQTNFAQQVLAIGKPVVLVLVNGGVVAIDNFIVGPSAIVEAFYPSMRGAEALSMLLFGQANRWGKLPVTMYPADYVNQVNMYNFDMSLAPGRTYRYYTGTPLFPFGFGLSYTTFSLSCQQGSSSFDCVVRNIGSRDGDEVVMVYHRVSDAIRQNVTHPVPLRQLVDFERVSVTVGNVAPISFTISDEYFAVTNTQGQTVVYPGEHFIDITRGYGQVSTFSVRVPAFRIVRTNAV